jgi:hypothetical protein
MPQLPGFEQLGAAVPAGPRPVGTINAQPIATGAERLGREIARAGQAVNDLDLARGRAQQYAAHEGAIADWMNLESSLGHDGDYATLRDRYADAMHKITDTWAETIDVPAFRERFRASMAPIRARGMAIVDEHARNLERQQTSADVIQRGTALAKTIAMLPPGDPLRETFVRLHDRRIDSLVDQSFQDPLWAAREKQNFRDDFLSADLIQRARANPEGALNTLRATPGSDEQLAERIIEVESGGDRLARGAGSSAYGLGQFTNDRWQEFISAAHPELKDGRSANAVGALRADPSLSREAVKWNIEQNREALQSSGLEPTAGNLYLAHFLGAAGAAKVIRADASTAIRDLLDPAAVANNRTILGDGTAAGVTEWAARKMQGIVPGEGSIYDSISPARRGQLQAELEALLQEKRSRDHLFEYRTREAVADDLAAVRRNGQGVSLEPGQVLGLLGPEAFREWQQARRDAREAWSATHEMPTLTDAELDSRIAAVRRNGEENSKSGIVDAVETAARQIRAQRREDPAASVQVDPQVKAAVSTHDPADPQSWRAVADARMAAQERAGIAERQRSPITNAEGVSLTAPLRRLAPGEEREALDGLAAQFRAMFGKDAEAALATALKAQRADQTRAERAARLILELGLGQPPDQADAGP